MEHQKEDVQRVSEKKFNISMLIDFAAGCIGGCAGVLVGHPLDTVKVHIQTQDAKNPVYKGTWHCLTTIFKEEHVRGLYRGISSPLMGISFVNAIVFGIYGNVQRIASEPDSLSSHCLAGSVAGFFQSVVCTPMELAKTRLQLQHEDFKGIRDKGTIDCLRNIVHTDGIRGPFRGLGITAARDIPGFASYFVSYEYLMTLPAHPNAIHTLMAGGMAGIFSWLTCYPIDVVKTCLQADGLTAEPLYKNAMDCAKQNYKLQGIRFFFRGINSTLVRAFPVNAACFLVVSWILGLAKDKVPDLVVHTTEPLSSVNIGAMNAVHTHLHMNEHRRRDMERKRTFMSRSLKALGAFHEAVCNSEVEELANEFYPDIDDSKYYIMEDERLPIEPPRDA